MTGLEGVVGVPIPLRSRCDSAAISVESVALRLHIEAAAIDSFIEQLIGLDPNKIGAAARLEMAR
jgi:hypothetical protein